MSDPGSPLVDFYPGDFVVDANGKKNAWECVVCIPFIQEALLVDEVSKIDHQVQLTEEERQRNTPGKVHRYLPKNGLRKDTLSGEDADNVNGGGGRAGQSVVNAKWGNALMDDRKNHLGGYKPYLGSFKPKRKY